MRPRKSDRHLPRCVYLRHGSYYWVSDGKWHPLGRDLATALAEYGRRIETPNGSMPELIERAYAHHLKTERLASSTARQYRQAADILKRKLTEFSPEQVKSRHVSSIQESLAETPNMANRVVSFLSTVFGYAVRWQLVDGNPCTGIDRLREGKRQRYITDAEFEAIRAQAGPRLQVIMDLQYLTAQRIDDVLTLRRADITEAGILLKPTKTKNSSGVRMLLRWSPDLRSVVERANRLNGNVRALTLLQGRGGKAPDYRTVALQWQKAAKAAGVSDTRPNDLRAKALTDANRQGRNPRALAGHATEAMTQRYLRQHDIPEVDGPSFGSVATGKAAS